MEDHAQGNSWELLEEGSDHLFDENLAISVEDLYAFLDEKPVQPPLSDEQSQITYEGLHQGKLHGFPVDAEFSAKPYIFGSTEYKECSGRVGPQWSTSDRIGALDCQKEVNVGFSLGSNENYNCNFPRSDDIRHASEHAESKHTLDYPSSWFSPSNQEYDISSRKNLVGSSRNSLMVRDLHNQQLQHAPSYNFDNVDKTNLIMSHYVESSHDLFLDSGQKVFEQTRSHDYEHCADDSHTMITDLSGLTDAERNNERRSIQRVSLFHDPYSYTDPSLTCQNLYDSKSMLNATEASGIMYNDCGSGYACRDSHTDGTRNTLHGQFSHPVFSHQKEDIVKHENEDQLDPSRSLSRGSEVELDTTVEFVGSLLQDFPMSDTVRPLLDACAGQNNSDDLSLESESSIDSSSYVSHKRDPSSRNSTSSDTELFVMNESENLFSDSLTNWPNKKQNISSMIGRDDQAQISHYHQSSLKYHDNGGAMSYMSSLKHHDNDGLRYVSVDDDADTCILDDVRNSTHPPPPHPFYTSNPTVLEQSGFTETYLPRFGGMRQKDERSNIQLALQVQDLSQPKSEACPPEGVLAVSLLRHQRIALHWMVQKETSNPHCCGGILADDQGLGKTVSTIALILMERSPSPQPFPSAGNHDKTEPLNLDDDEEDDISKINEAKQLRVCSSSMASVSKRRGEQEIMPVKSSPAAGTLVVSPTSVLRQWAEELKTKVACSANLSILVYHGSNRTKDAYELAKYDVVLTTYAIVSMEVPKQPLADKDDERGNYDGHMESMVYKKGKETLSASRKNVKDGNVKSAARPLARVSWFRVILDEAQSIKNHRTQVARACWGLRAKRRWCLSGTPIQNAVDDLYSYFRFLRYDPLDAYKSFCSMIKNPISRNPSKGYERLQLILKTIMLRRTKGTMLDGQPIITLPPKTITLKKVDFSKEERAFYTHLEAESREQFKVYANEGTVKQNYVNILLMLLRLRQACDHCFLVNGYGSNSVERSSIEIARKLPKEKQKGLLSCLEACLAICTLCNDPPEDAVVTICGHVFCNQCLREHFNGDDNMCPSADCKVRLTAASVFTRSTIASSICDMPVEVCHSTGCSSDISDATKSDGCSYSSKIKAALDILQSLPRCQCYLPDCNSSKPKEEGCLQNGVNTVSQRCFVTTNEGKNPKPNCQHSEKALVFSQWTRMLDLLEVPLRESCIQYRRLDGTMSVANRDKAIKDFNNLPEVTVMIMSLKAASLGLNLVVACHVLLLDLWWNPTTEDQAIDRAHRIGQRRPVTVSRLTVKDTVEDRILALQEKKREMVASAFGADESGSRQTRLTVEDLNYLFMV
ncbi:helicase-like transcription factor CHR28 isoform X1 [Curcuma longa]|uniref:helicase-like transcription factor CHR28 isoform X1 n=1 Tax=Curcuma longa TaxID=136217 RepID=UPI003D9F92CB